MRVKPEATSDQYSMLAARGAAYNAVKSDDKSENDYWQLVENFCARVSLRRPDGNKSLMNWDILTAP